MWLNLFAVWRTLSWSTESSRLNSQSWKHIVFSCYLPSLVIFCSPLTSFTSPWESSKGLSINTVEQSRGLFHEDLYSRCCSISFALPDAHSWSKWSKLQRQDSSLSHPEVPQIKMTWVCTGSRLSPAWESEEMASQLGLPQAQSWRATQACCCFPLVVVCNRCLVTGTRRKGSDPAVAWGCVQVSALGILVLSIHRECACMS